MSRSSSLPVSGFFHLAFNPWGGTPRGGSFGILPQLFFRLPSSSSGSLPRRTSPSSSRATVTLVVVLVLVSSKELVLARVPKAAALSLSGFGPPSCRPPARRRRREDGDARLPRRSMEARLPSLSLPLPLPSPRSRAHRGNVGWKTLKSDRRDLFGGRGDKVQGRGRGSKID